MATVKVCDKCNNIGAHSRATLWLDREHERGKEIWTIREKVTYDLCDKCALEVAKIIDPFADAMVCHVDDIEE